MGGFHTCPKIWADSCVRSEWQSGGEVIGNTAKYKTRLAGVKRKLSKFGCQALLVDGEEDIIYLTGFYSLDAMVFISGKGKPVYLIDNMNKGLAEKMLDQSAVEILSGSVMKNLFEVIHAGKVKKLGINGKTLSVAIYKNVLRMIKGLNAVETDSILEDMRLRKVPEEINNLRLAARETVKIWKETEEKIRFGMTEKEIARIINIEIRKRDENNSFSTIAAIGPNSVDPHALPTDRRLGKNEHVLVDFGLRVNDYCSDLTRIWAKGKISRKIMDLKNAVLEVQDSIIKKISPGEAIGSLAKQANKHFIDKGLGKYICHGLGHGVGLGIHERPHFFESNRLRLKENMVITIEPGLYMKGIGGVRIEDMVLVTKKGCEVLTRW